MKNALKFNFPMLSLFCLLFPLLVFAQQNAQVKRVSFTLCNPTLKASALDIRYFDPTTKNTAGYGLNLGPLKSHADNKPVGTRIYLKKGNSYALAFVLADGDDGRKFNLNKDYGISPEQRLQAGRDEQGERLADLENPDAGDDLATFAQRHNVPMVSFVVTGKSPYKRQVHVRAQLPFVAERTNNGFSRKISSFSKVRCSYPAGTKIFVCDGPYWNGGNIKETLVLTLEAEKQGNLVKI